MSLRFINVVAWALTFDPLTQSCVFSATCRLLCAWHSGAHLLGRRQECPSAGKRNPCTQPFFLLFHPSFTTPHFVPSLPPSPVPPSLPRLHPSSVRAIRFEALPSQNTLLLGIMGQVISGWIHLKPRKPVWASTWGSCQPSARFWDVGVRFFESDLFFSFLRLSWLERMLRCLLFLREAWESTKPSAVVPRK